MPRSELPPSESIKASVRASSGLCISNYEQGIRRLGIEEAQILAESLATVSASYLLFLDHEEFLGAQEADLHRCFRRMDERGRETILGLAESQCDTGRI